jgi:hypothetical protein
VEWILTDIEDLELFYRDGLTFESAAYYGSDEVVYVYRPTEPFDVDGVRYDYLDVADTVQPMVSLKDDGKGSFSDAARICLCSPPDEQEIRDFLNGYWMSPCPHSGEVTL